MRGIGESPERPNVLNDSLVQNSPTKLLYLCSVSVLYSNFAGGLVQKKWL